VECRSSVLSFPTYSILTAIQSTHYSISTNYPSHLKMKFTAPLLLALAAMVIAFPVADPVEERGAPALEARSSASDKANCSKGKMMLSHGVCFPQYVSSLLQDFMLTTSNLENDRQPCRASCEFPLSSECSNLLI
jgi:hypothetical protein